jgi:hypothetical protein
MSDNSVRKVLYDPILVPDKRRLLTFELLTLERPRPGGIPSACCGLALKVLDNSNQNILESIGFELRENEHACR